MDRGFGSISKTVVILALVAACYPEQKKRNFSSNRFLLYYGPRKPSFLAGWWMILQTSS